MAADSGVYGGARGRQWGARCRRRGVVDMIETVEVEPNRHEALADENRLARRTRMGIR